MKSEVRQWPPRRQGLPVLCKLSSLVQLNPEELALLQDISSRVERFRPNTEIIPENSNFEASRFLLSGWACRARTSPDGRRQILDFYLPGDIIGYCARSATKTVVPYIALTNVETSSASKLHRHLHDDLMPGLKLASVQIEHLHEILLLNQIARTGRQAAYERVAHLFLEFLFRFRLAGGATDNAFPCPLTQEMIADGLGLSIVHVNRTMQQLRRDRLIEIKDGFVILPDVQRLNAVADFHAPI
jgi:CRP-like cAMP-binding protein